jgi:hypothetical protein
MVYLLILASMCFLIHLILENISTFIRYNLAGLNKHMQGAAIANFFAIASRASVAAYGLLIAYVIENSTLNGLVYGGIMAVPLFLGAIISYLLSNVSVIDFEKLKKYKEFRGAYVRGAINLSKSNRSKIKINKIMSMFVGVQFISVVLAYSLCFEYVEQRLLIISFVPILSMFGTIVSVVFIEPKLAKAIDNNFKMGRAVSQEYMRARAASFMISFFVLLIITFMSEY